jgi:hypothetical protein
LRRSTGLARRPGHRQVLHLQAVQAVVGGQCQAVQLLGYAQGDPLVAAAAQRGGRAGVVGDAMVAAAEDQDLDELVEDDAVGMRWRWQPRRWWTWRIGSSAATWSQRGSSCRMGSQARNLQVITGCESFGDHHGSRLPCPPSTLTGTGPERSGASFLAEVGPAEVAGHAAQDLDGGQVVVGADAGGDQAAVGGHLGQQGGVGRGAGLGRGGVVAGGPGQPAAGVEVLEDRADRRVALVQERGQVGVEPVDGGWAGLEGGEDLPVASGEPFLREQPVEALVDQAVDQLQPEADGTPVGRDGWPYP